MFSFSVFYNNSKIPSSVILKKFCCGAKETFLKSLFASEELDIDPLLEPAEEVTAACKNIFKSINFLY